MSDIAFTNNNPSSNLGKVINTMIAYRSYDEYLKYKDRPMSEIAELMNSRSRELLEERLIDNLIDRIMNSLAIQELIEKKLTKLLDEAIEKGLGIK